MSVPQCLPVAPHDSSLRYKSKTIRPSPTASNQTRPNDVVRRTSQTAMSKATRESIVTAALIAEKLQQDAAWGAMPPHITDHPAFGTKHFGVGKEGNLPVEHVSETCPVRSRHESIPPTCSIAAMSSTVSGSEQLKLIPPNYVIRMAYERLQSRHQRRDGAQPDQVLPKSRPSRTLAMH